MPIVGCLHQRWTTGNLEEALAATSKSPNVVTARGLLGTTDAIAVVSIGRSDSSSSIETLGQIVDGIRSVPLVEVVVPYVCDWSEQFTVA